MSRKIAMLTLSTMFALFIIMGAANANWTGIANKPSAQTAALGTAFTYQGRLEDGGRPANGTYDFEFRLYDDPDIGEGIFINLVKVDDMQVTDGLVTTQLDFGDVFDGTAYYLEAGVRAGSSQDAYTTLSPRQALTATPYALFAANASTTGHDHLGQTWTGSNNPLVITGIFGAPNYAALVLGNNNIDGNALIVEKANDGIHVNSASDDGIDIDSAGNPSWEFNSNDSNGIEIDGAQANGVFVGQADLNGVYVYNAGNDGVYVNAANYYAGYFKGSIYVESGCVNCVLTNFGINKSDGYLEPGEILTIKGIQTTETNMIPMLMEVAPAQGGETIIGVVQGRAEYVTESDPVTGETRKRLVPRDGGTEPGGYVTIIIYGPTQVKNVNSGEIIEAGARLVVDKSGFVRPLRTVELEGVQLTEQAPTVGIALEHMTREGSLWVLVNPH